MDFLAPIQFGLNLQHLLLELLKKKDDNFYNKVAFMENKDKKENKNKKDKKENKDKDEIKEKEIILDYKNEIYNKYKNMPIGEAFKKCDEENTIGIAE